MKLKKILSFLGLLISPLSAFAVSVAQQPAVQQATTTATSSTGATIGKWLSISLIVGGVIVLLIIIIGLFIFYVLFQKMKVWFAEAERTKHDLLYQNYWHDRNVCMRNAQKNMRWATWYTFWLWVRRAKVFIETPRGRIALGKYNGHARKSDGLCVVSVIQKHSLRQKSEYCILIPSKIYEACCYIDTVSTKIPSFVIRAEGIDTFYQTEFYSLLSLKMPEQIIENAKVTIKAESYYKNNLDYLDYAEDMAKTYFEKNNIRIMLKEKDAMMKESVIDATEGSPSINRQRRS